MSPDSAQRTSSDGAGYRFDVNRFIASGNPWVVGADEFTRLLRTGIATDELGTASRVPAVAVDLTDGPDASSWGDLVDPLPAVVVGTCRKPFDSPPPCDLLLTEEPDPPAPWVSCPSGITESLDRIFELVSLQPLASVVLVQLLRMRSPLPVQDAIVAESLAYSTLQSGPGHKAWLATRKPPRPRHRADPAALVTREGGSLCITLNRPEVHNAFNAAMRDDLIAGLQVAAVDPSITEVTIRGAGSSFCSGGDLDEFGTAPDAATAHMIRTTRSAGRWIDACADRCTVIVHGSCIGAGVELAAFARRIRAATGSTFMLPEIAMGLIPGAGGTVSIPKRIGRERAAYMALNGRPIDTTLAIQWGLVDEIWA
jgi:hypothetical protein